MIANAVTFIVGAEAANAKTINVQLKTINGVDLAEAAVIDMYLSSDAAGQVPIDAQATGIVPTAGADGALLEAPVDATNDYTWQMVSEADGDLDIVLTNAGDETETVYLNVILANGKLKTTVAVAFADDTP